MEVSEIMKLVNAGFTKDEIFQLVDSSAKKAQEKGEVKEPVTEPKEPVTEPSPTVPEEAKSGQVTLTDAQLKELIQGIAVKTASGSIEVPEDMDTKLSAHLESILKGD